MEPIKLDIKDKKILSIIDMNARLSNSQVGKLVGLSRKSVEYRIKKMEDLKVIKRYFCKLNYVNLGYSIYKMFIRLVNIDPNLEQEIEDFSKTNNQFYWFHKYRGRFDFGIGTVVKTIQEYKEFQSTFLERFSVNIAEKSVSQAVSTNFYSHSYIHDKRDFVSYSHSTKQNKNITEIDKKILGLLAKDCKMPIVTMAQQLKVSNSTVSSRIDKMLDNNIILCFRTQVDFVKLGYSYYKVFINLKKPKTEMSKMLSIVSSNKNVIYSTIPVGKYDFECEVVAKNFKEFYDIIANIRRSGCDILHFDYAVAGEVYKINPNKILK